MSWAPALAGVAAVMCFASSLRARAEPPTGEGAGERAQLLRLVDAALGALDGRLFGAPPPLPPSYAVHAPLRDARGLDPRAPYPLREPPRLALPASAPRGPRLRFGLGLAVGGAVGDPSIDVQLGVQLQLGLQAHDLAAFYLQTTLLSGEFYDRETGQHGTTPIVVWNAFVSELSLFRRLQLGVGPSLDLVADCPAHQGAGDSGCRHRLRPGVHARAAWVFGRHRRLPAAWTLDLHHTPLAFGTFQTTLVGGVQVLLD